MASSKREKELARQRAERQAARRAAAAQRRKQRNAVIASIAAVVLVAIAAVATALALNDPAGETTTVAQGEPDTSAAPAETTAPETTAPETAPAAAPSTAAPAASARPAGDPGCVYEETGEPAAKEVPALPPTEGVETEQVYNVTLTTNRGDIVFEMDSAEAPCTANNLRSLAHFKYFDETTCHRLTTEGIEVLQCGDPSGTGSGGPGYQFADENLEGATYPRGTVAMANAGPGTNGSQFFLVYGDSTLPPNYTPFGTIVSGLEILDQVAAGGSDESNGAGDGKPNTPLVIETLRAKPKPA